MSGQRGFALVLMMAALAGGGALFVLALGSHAPFRPVDLEVEARARSERIADAAVAVYLRDGAFPPDLAALTATGLLPLDEEWAVDPHGAGAQLGYALSGSPASLSIRAVGPDFQAGTADDIVASRSSSALARARTLRRLGALRVAYLDSDYMAGTLGASERAQLGDAMRRFARAQRALVFASGAQRSALITERDSAAATVASIRSSNSLPALPSDVLGVGGLLDGVGCPQSLGDDGFGQTFVVHEAVGFLSEGADGVGGTDDDF